ncbi:restriction endonuclease subunit S [Parasphingorhabdus sp.]|uniref:restriction endonuclease subunit S n=1 Tax=Parasphingorhabdus sp. TaxID=2709688 RepID=UPI003D28BBEE
MEPHKFFASFEHVTDAPGGMDQLRRLILSTAFNGKLVSKLAHSSSLDNLMMSIQSEIADQIALGEIRKPKPLPNLEDNEISDPIPSHWRWVRFGQIARHNSGKTLDKKRNTGNSTKYITTSNLYWGRFELTNVRAMLIRDEELAACTAKKGDLLICEGGEAGRAAVWSDDEDVCFQNHIHRARLYANIDPHFIFRFLQKLHFTGEIAAHRKGIGISNMSGKALSMIPIPLAPPEEQRLIVTKLEQLMTLCDQLEKQQKDRRKLQNDARKALVESVDHATTPRDVVAQWDRLASRFIDFFTSPEDIEDLRGLVCGLAVRGLVTEHITEMESAEDLVAKLNALRVALQSDGKAPRMKAIVPEKLRGVSFPSHWTAISLNDAISGIDAGWSPACLPTPRRQDTTWGVLKTTSVQKMCFNANEHKELPSSLEPRPKHELRDGDILITRAGPKNRVGICCVAKNVPPRLMISDKLIRFHIAGDLISSDFVAMCITYGETGRILERLKSGMADSQMNISQDKLRSLPIPVPPYEEQLVILERIDALMDICDQLEEQLIRKQKVSEMLASACVTSITGIAAIEEEANLKTPQTELIALLHLGQQPSVKERAPLASILARQGGEVSAKDLWQRFGGEIDSFYAQLKLEVSNGWIVEPQVAEMREQEAL